MPDLFGMQVGFSDQMILDIAKQQTVISLLIDKVAHSLRVVKLRISKSSLNIAHLAVSNLLNELIGGGIDNQIAIVGRISNNKKFFDVVIIGESRLLLVFLSPHSDNFSRVA